eukprot:CAMPEP_0119293906 /NCGR_PEP_ID=MMETSP1329-20130426/46892_1 /TAXON_ID=114041 /ORGANISM="Genus nov. species nov., Strain RCC1024" /LENGTH=47 /DNA_ID= /DNA_START= /DNA_END= /DNA_ORIENTATION=
MALQWYTVIGKQGATLREGCNLDTPLVGELARNEIVAVETHPDAYAT